MTSDDILLLVFVLLLLLLWWEVLVKPLKFNSDESNVDAVTGTWWEIKPKETCPVVAKYNAGTFQPPRMD
jgi:hypothetical protein